MDLGLVGKIALVAASSRGLGRAVAEELAAEGAALSLCARGEDALIRTRGEIADATGVDVMATPTDLSVQEEVRTLIDRTLERYGRIDVLVTNSGGPPPGPFESHPMDAWRAAIRSNLESVLGLVRGSLPGMRERGWGRVVNITSIAVKQPVDGLILSNSVRAAVTGFARTLANEAAPNGITVNNVMPGYTWTERVEKLARDRAEAEGVTPEQATAGWVEEIPAGRLADPEELAALVAFLASERAAYITGASIPVDGGWIRSLL
ncbi:MAG: SDR family oxidoreductase [Gemmatimonadota bacterium]